METTDIFDVLHYGTIVCRDDDRRILITYNGSATYNAWVADADGYFVNFDVRTVYPDGNRTSVTYEEAKREAYERFRDMERE